MINSKLAGLVVGVLCVAVAAPSAQAENAQDFGPYVVHYNALTTDALPPEIAERYELKRSKNRGLVNIAVLKKSLGTSGEPVTAQVEAEAVNLSGQVKHLHMREIREGNAIYYLGVFGVAHHETLDFTIDVRPKDADTGYTVRFRHEFYTR